MSTLPEVIPQVGHDQGRCEPSQTHTLLSHQWEGRVDLLHLSNPFILYRIYSTRDQILLHNLLVLWSILSLLLAHLPLPCIHRMILTTSFWHSPLISGTCILCSWPLLTAQHWPHYSPTNLSLQLHWHPSMTEDSTDLSPSRPVCCHDVGDIHIDIPISLDHIPPFWLPGRSCEPQLSVSSPLKDHIFSFHPVILSPLPCCASQTIFQFFFHVLHIHSTPVRSSSFH